VRSTAANTRHHEGRLRWTAAVLSLQAPIALSNLVCPTLRAQPCFISTEAGPPKPYDRTTIGVGERVIIDFPNEYWSPNAENTAVASLQGPGHLVVPPPARSHGVEFIAGDEAGSSTVSVNVPNSGCHLKVTFTVIAPTGIKYVQDSGTLHLQGLPVVGAILKMYMQPSTVSFGCLLFREVNAPWHATGIFADLDGTYHTSEQTLLVGDFDQKLGSFIGQDVTILDLKQSYLVQSQSRPYPPSTAILEFPVQYRTFDSSTFHTFATAKVEAFMLLDGLGGNVMSLRKYTEGNEAEGFSVPWFSLSEPGSFINFDYHYISPSCDYHDIPYQKPSGDSPLLNRIAPQLNKMPLTQ
jgi:hypothetical protein